MSGDSLKIGDRVKLNLVYNFHINTHLESSKEFVFRSSINNESDPILHIACKKELLEDIKTLQQVYNLMEDE